MIITSIETFPIREPRSARSYTILRVRTRDGITGYGEAARIDTARIQAAAQGQPATRYEVLRTQLAGVAGAAALDMAMLDICGQAAKAPVYQLLGGPTRNKVRALADTDDLAGAAKIGHKAFFARLSPPQFGTSRPKYSALAREAIERVRKTIDNAEVVVDANAQLKSAEASDVAITLEKYHPLWLDEPCLSTNGDVLHRISSECGTPLGLGRHVDNTGEIQNLLRDQVIDIVRLDLRRFGISGIRRAAALAETYYVAVAPFHDGGPIATAAALHLAASLPNFFIQQVPLASADRDELVGASLEKPIDGFLPLSTKPGLGIRVNEAALRRFAA